MRTRSLPAIAAVLATVAACSSDGSDEAADTTQPSTTEVAETTETEPEPEVPATDPVPTTTEAPAPAPAGEELVAIADQEDQPHGSNVITSTLSYTETVDAVGAAIDGNPALTLVAEIDHAVNAAIADLELGPATVFLFGNPALGTPLMQENPATAIDLPQRMLVTEDLDGTVQVWWNDPNFIASRHGLGPASLEALATIDGALIAIGGGAAGTEEEPTYAFPTIGVGDGVVAVDATGTVQEVVDRLVAAIDANEALTLVATVDHSANATNAGLELPPTTTVIFGNPNLGTPLMREARTIGLDLPQKITVTETEFGLQVLYNDPTEFAIRHGIDELAEPLPTIAGALEGLAATAAG